jgi:hypothetical protein
MSLSGVLVLGEIGLAVCVGVASMLAANLLRRGRLAAPE